MATEGGRAKEGVADDPLGNGTWRAVMAIAGRISKGTTPVVEETSTCSAEAGTTIFAGVMATMEDPVAVLELLGTEDTYQASSVLIVVVRPPGHRLQHNNKLGVRLHSLHLQRVLHHRQMSWRKQSPC